MILSKGGMNVFNVVNWDVSNELYEFYNITPPKNFLEFDSSIIVDGNFSVRKMSNGHLKKT